VARARSREAPCGGEGDVEDAHGGAAPVHDGVSRVRGSL
jgi:hypothetical protein